jgi:hypothetical protein
MGHIVVEIERLNRTNGFTYQIALAGLIARHGRDAVVKALASIHTDNVISIATSPNWCRPIQPNREYRIRRI